MDFFVCLANLLCIIPFINPTCALQKWRNSKYFEARLNVLHSMALVAPRITSERPITENLWKSDGQRRFLFDGVRKDKARWDINTRQETPLQIRLISCISFGIQRRKCLTAEIYVTWVTTGKILKTVEFGMIRNWSRVRGCLFDSILSSAVRTEPSEIKETIL